MSSAMNEHATIEELLEAGCPNNSCFKNNTHSYALQALNPLVSPNPASCH
jgi:hypothetical protein